MTCRHLSLGDYGFKVVDAEEAEKAEFIACMPAGTVTQFDDNVEAECGLCGAKVIHRPTAPKKPIRACIDCIRAMLQEKN